MSKSGNILIVDDDEDILTAGRLLLQREFARVTGCRNPLDVPGLLEQNSIDAILLDMNFGPGESSGAQGLEWLEKILAIDPEMVVVMITAHGSMNTAIEAMKRGATDFIVKPWQNEKLIATVSTAVKLRISRRESERLRRSNQVLMQAAAKTSDLIIGDSRKMQDVMRMVRRAAPTDANVLILGENGTGKELIARELHRQSARADKVFLTVDMGSLSESLFEAELFGHKKGAFTNANEERLGRFQAADGGTLFLDEIGNLPLHLQAKLLRVLEERKVTPVGADNAQAVDVRIIAATNMPPPHLQDDQQFRQDLLFRLNTVEMTIPPLRERRDDIVAIAEHFVALYARKYHKGEVKISPEANRALTDYEWPGNVRALRHAIERAVILGDGKELKPEDLQLKPEETASNRSRVAALPTILNLDQLERDAVKKALAKHGFNISKTAAELGLTRASLYRRMEKHDL